MNENYSLAPLEVVISRDHTDGVHIPGLDHVTHRNHGVLLRVIFQNVIISIVRSIVITATYNVFLSLNYC